ncbi:CPBP family glutamic-type intramembrane protease [Angustibacter sp. McL0619]|uniref:CPBP family glutamic-type intramembrane protease n=1 Tax=Angustibacter sp. McL0619 TaxID=3415676 RepID=UPI003CF4F280
MSNPDVSDGPPPVRALPYWAFAVIVLVYLAIIHGVGVLARHVWDVDNSFVTTRDVLVNMWVPLGSALVFTYAVVAALHWWRPVLHDDRPVQRWVRIVPLILIASIVVGIDYADLLDKNLTYVLSLLVATQFVGWGEEGMFRGIGVTTLRLHGLSEGKVALWSSVIFGAVHLSNAFGQGAGAIPQAIAVSFAGYFFYLTRRSSGGNALNSVLHGLFDFSLLTGTAILVDQKAYPGGLAAILAYLVIAVILLVRRHHIEPEDRVRTS